jgi:hypothetical protein
MNLVVRNETYVRERGCCAEVDSCECSSCAKLCVCVMDLVARNVTYVCGRRRCTELTLVCDLAVANSVNVCWISLYRSVLWKY